MKLEFETIERSDGQFAKRAHVSDGYIYLFTDYDGCSHSTSCCFVPDPPKGVHQVMHIDADDLHALRGGQ